MKKNKTIKIGLMPGGIDGLMIARQSKIAGVKFKFLIPRGKEEAAWSQRFLPKADLVFYDLLNHRWSMADLDLADVARKSNLLKVLKKEGISHLLVHHSVEASFARWASSNKIVLIAPDDILANKLEHKIWFDNFLIKNKLPTPSSEVVRFDSAKLKLTPPVVLQDPSSWGGEGTYFINRQSEIKKLIFNKQIARNKKYLVRKFISGESYGITLFLSRNLTALSALRRQCYGLKNDHQQKSFLGIQWVESKKVSPGLILDINKTFRRLGESLRSLGFVGYVNIDFIASTSGVKILEANPRIAASSSQLVLFPETISQVNTAKLYLEALLQRNNFGPLKIIFSSFPSRSKFNGGTLYIQTTKDKFLIRNHYPAGVYRINGSKISFITSDISKVNRYQKSFIFYPDVQPGEILSKDMVIATVISDFPLYDDRGKLNNYGKMISRHFKY